MCDYSLQNVKSRPAQVGDKLIVSSFSVSITKGLASADDCNTAVCLLPGTQVGFDDNIAEEHGGYWPWSKAAEEHESKVAKFVQVNVENPYTHHDAFEMPDGSRVLLTNLKSGQRATVLQLPAPPVTVEDREEQRRAEYVG